MERLRTDMKYGPLRQAHKKPPLVSKGGL